MRIALAAVLAAVMIAGGVLVALSGHTAIWVSPAVTSIGVSTPVTVRLANPHGVREVRVCAGAGRREVPGVRVQERRHAPALAQTRERR